MCRPDDLNDQGTWAGMGGNQDGYDRELPEAERNGRIDSNLYYDGSVTNSLHEQQYYGLAAQGQQYFPYPPNLNNYFPGHSVVGFGATPTTPSNVVAVPQHAQRTSHGDDRMCQQDIQQHPVECDAVRPGGVVASIPNRETTDGYEHKPIVDAASSINFVDGFAAAGTSMFVAQEHGEMVTEENATDPQPISDPRASAKVSEKRYRDKVDSSYKSLIKAINGPAAEAVARKSRPKLLQVATDQIVNLKSTVQSQREEILGLKHRLAELEKRLLSTSH